MITKVELQQANVALSTECAALRARVSMLEAQIKLAPKPVAYVKYVDPRVVERSAKLAAAREEAMRTGRSVAVS